MRDIFERYIDWDILEERGGFKEENFRFEITDAVIRKGTGVLTIWLALNFVLPEISERKIKGVILNSVSHINDVEFKYEYKDMIQSPGDYLDSYLPKMIERANGTFRGTTENIIKEGSTFDGTTFKIKALGNIMVEKLRL